MKFILLRTETTLEDQMICILIEFEKKVFLFFFFFFRNQIAKSPEFDTGWPNGQKIENIFKLRPRQQN